MKFAPSCLLLLFLSGLCSGVCFAVQGPSGERVKKPVKKEKPKAAAKASPRKPSQTVVKKPVKPQTQPKEIPLAELSVSVNPPDSRIIINGQEYEYRDRNGFLTLSGLRPGAHTVVARKAGYRDQERTLSLANGQKAHLDLSLSMLPGRLNVLTNISGAEISISNAGNFSHQVRDLELAPGRYQITVSKSGYETVAQEVIIQPAASRELMVGLEPLKPPPPVRNTIRAAIASFIDGKFLIVNLTGMLGQTANRAGSLSFTLNPYETANLNQVSGALPGLPCRVNCLPLENVSECSFREAPGIANQWAGLTLRVRPKNPARAVRFSVDWQLIR